MKKGVSPLISFVITILIVTVAVTIVMTVIKPTFDSMMDENVLREGMKNLDLINSVIRQVSSESEGSKRTVSISVTDGYYGINTTHEYIYFDYETKTDYKIESPMPIGSVRIDKSPIFIEYFNSYTEGSNASSLWTIKNGTWRVESGEYSGQNGLAYYHHGTLSQFSFQGWITNKEGNGEIFILPISPEYLVGYWTFDEGYGNYVFDYSGFNNTGILNGASWTNGKFDYGLSFDGVDDYVNVSLLSDMGMTVSLWKKSSTDETWYHLVNSSGILYVNGIVGSGHDIPVTNVSGSVIIGKYSLENYFNGTLDEVMIFNTSLTPAQVKSLYETSWKKLSSTGKSDIISSATDVYLVLSNPKGHTHFDELKIKTDKRIMRLSIPYTNIDLNGTARFGKGEYKITITHKGINATVNKPIIEIKID